MSSVIIAGDTSGSITVAAPAAAGTNTITMPAATGTMALTSDITTEIPSQTGNAGKLLTTNGSAASWGGVSDYTTFTNLTEKVTVAATAATGTIRLCVHYEPHRLGGRISYSMRRCN